MRITIFAFLALSFLGLSHCAVHADGAAYGKVLNERLGVRAEGFDVDGRPAFVLLPEKLPTNRLQPWILYAPALPAYPDEHERWMHQQFVKAGVAVAGVDVGEAYGSPRGCAGVSALYDELVNNRGFSPKPCLFGRSRGGLWVVNWAGRNPEKAAGIVGIYPAFDLRTYPGLEKAAPAYQLSVEQLEAELKKYNPIAQAGKLAKAKMPATFIHGLDDQIVPFEENTGEFSEQYRAAGADELITVIAVDGKGHDFWEGFFRSPELVKHAVKYAKAGARANEPRTIEFSEDSLDAVKRNVAEKKAVLVDVRSEAEWTEGHIEGSIFLPVTSLRKHSFDPAKVDEKLPKKNEKKILYTFCVVGMRAKQAGLILEREGYVVRVLKPGYEELVAAGFEKAHGKPAPSAGSAPDD